MVLANEGQEQRRCDRNRKRSKRRAILCPEHGIHMDSVSQKYPLFACDAHHLRERGYGRQTATLLVATYGTVPLNGEWLESFWCDHCQETRWYYVKREADNRTFTLTPAPKELWQQVSGVVNPYGNPTVSEFTRKAARANGLHGRKVFNFLR
ncbi:MAG: hypothetical protein ACOYME_03080 [Prochlorotrichaceae cyanobacterium]